MSHDLRNSPFVSPFLSPDLGIYVGVLLLFIRLLISGFYSDEQQIGRSGSHCWLIFGNIILSVIIFMIVLNQCVPKFKFISIRNRVFGILNSNFQRLWIFLEVTLNSKKEEEELVDSPLSFLQLLIFHSRIFLY